MGMVMSQTGLAQFDSTIQATNVWLRDLMEELGWDDRARAYHALRAVLHALRDRLGVDEVAGLAAQMPMLLRGCFYEGWHPAGKPLREHHKGEFLAEVSAALRATPGGDPARVVRAVFRTMAHHVSSGEIESIKHVLPGDIRILWSS
jgi:uncharacterized protein (DUF2267 family)